VALADVTGSGAPRPGAMPNAADSALASTGSPATVPVACASAMATCAGSTPARASAFLMRDTWAFADGAPCIDFQPSWLAPVATTSAYTRHADRGTRGSRAAAAAGPGSSTMATAPSPRTKPSAAASKGMEEPEKERTPFSASVRKKWGDSSALTPISRAASHDPAAMDSHATCRAYREDEQAVSRVREGPVRSNPVDTQLDR